MRPDPKRARKQNVVYVTKRKKPKAFEASQDYHPEEILGICTNCNMVGFVDFGEHFTWNDGDNLMALEALKRKILCSGCGRYIDHFVPFDPKVHTPENGYKIMATSQRQVLEDLR